MAIEVQPVQEARDELEAGVAIKIMVEPLENEPTQSRPQDIDDGEDVVVPNPVPCFFTVRVR